jgi:SRSO17 transposase
METYSSRWVIEKFFRSAKQSLGLEDCRSQKFDGIVKHIWAVMRSFTTLELLRFAKRKKSVEAVLAILRDKKRGVLSHQYADLIETLIEF